ncbi:MAG: hypothetical protein LKE36_00355 [Bacilli bacterium]|nr:hypothetical protein [Bacilli bacterium]
MNRIIAWTLVTKAGDFYLEYIRSQIFYQISTSSGVRIINSIDAENNTIYVTSSELHELEKVTYKQRIVDSNDKPYDISKIVIGDEISFFYYERYKDYTPKHVYVD